MSIKLVHYEIKLNKWYFSMHEALRTIKAYKQHKTNGTHDKHRQQYLLEAHVYVKFYIYQALVSYQIK